jgi:beta-lactamase class A
LNFLQQLQAGQLISPAATARLLTIMAATTTGQARLKAGLPPGATLAHKTGTSRTDLGLTAATNDIGIVTLEGGRALAVAVFLSASMADEAAREAAIAEVMRTIAGAAR